ncbi:uncharacterized protein LOC131680588 [Topomyia yanbarensis]|uniref:uncharacterized protein LOC131680588 n=1 Tax=Topomyia yanbarensis TaxID=2498891 RepID=UPI00273B3C64|nr:uncharacterized protein LOC131680588 [Topomyia yanbarensis]
MYLKPKFNRIFLLGMVEVRESQTAKFLKRKVLDVLSRYDVSIDQIFSITSDNGANMLSAAKQLQEHFTYTIQSNGNMQSDGMEDDSRRDDLVEALTTELSTHFNIVRCAAHTLQLALNDVVRNTDPNVKCITDFVKSVKKIKYKSSFDVNKASYPPLWSPTRWSGKYVMIRSIIQQESFFTSLVEQFPELSLNEEDWEYMKEYEAAFKPLYVTTKLMQLNHQTFSDFYLQWLLAIKDIKTLANNRFSEPLLESLNRRIAVLKENMAFKSALYLDPRFNFLHSTVFTPDENNNVQVNTNRSNRNNVFKYI